MREAIASPRLSGPRLHLFVCANRRESGSPLGPGCSGSGDEVYDALKREVGERGLVAQVWVTKTHCLGICPKQGATVARYAMEERERGVGVAAGLGTQAILTEVSPDDASTLISSSSSSNEAPQPETPTPTPTPTLEDLAREIDALHDLQRKKVLDLARRLKPGLTLEDVQNPHDFPELDDPDWHYADGVLTGIASVKSALAAVASRARSNADANDDDVED